jgi:peroxiredoxin
MLVHSGKIPNVRVCRLEEDKLVPYDTGPLFATGLNILVGVPGAYTPICTHDHIPSLIRQADDIRAAGVKNIFCVSDDNPWTVDIWSRSIPGHEKIIFLSDGNKDFLNATRLFNDQRDYFIAGGYGRFYALIEDGIIRRIRSEVTVLETVCTNGDSILTDIEDILSQGIARG